jgi:hypothetical protein
MSSPELCIQDFGGLHNGDLSKTSARLIKGASWKRQRIVVIIPADAMIPAKCALAIWNLILPPNNGCVRILCQGCEVGAAYSAAIESVLAHPELKDWEYILTIEQDCGCPSDGVLKLVEEMEAHPEFSAISGSYFTKGIGGVWQCWGDPGDPILNFRPRVPQASGLVECCGLGMGFCLFRLSMFKDTRLRRPWFVTQKGASGVSTQDLYAWSDFRKWGHRCAVSADVKCGHWESSTNTMW